MSLSSVESVKLRHLAAKGTGLPCYVQKERALCEIKTKNLSHETSDFRCTAVALALFTILAAVGSLALFLHSNQLTHTQVIAFAIGFGCLSLGFIAALCIRVKRYLDKIKEIETTQSALPDEPISFDKILRQMEKEETEKMAIRASFEGMRGHRRAFLKYIQEQYFGENKPPLSFDQRRVLQGIASLTFITKLEREELTRSLHPDFALEMLKGIDPIAAKDESEWVIAREEEKRIRDFKATYRLFLCALHCKESDLPAQLARHPIVFAHLVNQNKHLSSELLYQTVSKMEDQGKEAFVHDLIKDFDSSTAEVIAGCLLNNLLATSKAFIDALDHKLEEGQKSLVFEKISLLLTSKSHKEMVQVINHYGEGIPPLLVSLYQSLPQQLALMKSELAPQLWDKMQQGMSVDNQSLLLGSIRENQSFLSLSGEEKETFQKMDTAAKIAYLNKNPQRMKPLLLDTDLTHRYTIAIVLLRQMEKEAVQRIISNLDLALQYKHYSELVNLLQKMAVEDTPPDLQRLMHLFKYAPGGLFEKSVGNPLTIGTKRLPDGPDWNLFNKAADCHKDK